MGLSGKEKKLIKKKVRVKSLVDIAEDLGVEEDEVEKYLIKIWGKKKFQRVVNEVKQEGKHREIAVEEINLDSFSFKKWIKENKWKILLILGITFLAYINAWGAEFLSDDIPAITGDPRVKTWDFVWANLLNVPRKFYYFVIINTFGLVPGAFRFIGIASHLLMVVAVFLLGELLVGRRVGFLAGILVGVHPIMIEAVTWISGGGHSQYSLFVVISFILYILGGKNRKYYWWSLISFFMALEFSEKAMMFLGILVMYHLLFVGKKRKWQDLIPFVLLDSIWIWWNLKNLSGRVSYLATQFSGGVSSQPKNPFIHIPVAISSYLNLIFWPDKLTLYHSELTFTPNQYVIMTIVTVLFFGIILWSLWKGIKDNKMAKQVCFWLSWLVIGLSITLTPFGVSWLVAERYVYFGAVGILMAIAIGVDWLSKKRGWYEAVMIGFSLIAGLLFIRTIVRNHDWKNQDNLWISAARVSPNSAQNHNNLGDMYQRWGDLDKAVEHFSRAIEINPRYAAANHNLANTYFRKKEFEKAIEHYQKAVELRSGLWQSHRELSRVYYTIGEKDLAKQELEKAIEINPEDETLQQLMQQLFSE